MKPQFLTKIRARPNRKCLATKHHQTLFGDQTFYRLATIRLVCDIENAETNNILTKRI